MAGNNMNISYLTLLSLSSLSILLCGCAGGSVPKKTETAPPNMKEAQAAFDKLASSWTNLHYTVVTKDILNKLKANVSSEELRLWTTTAISSHIAQTSPERDALIPTNEWPGWIAKIDRSRPLVVSVSGDDKSKRHVNVLWGGGWGGFYGFEIGDETFRPLPSDRYYLEWQPGIYAWHNTH